LAKALSGEPTTPPKDPVPVEVPVSVDPKEPPGPPPGDGDGGGKDGGEKDQSCDPKAQSLWDPRNPFSPLNPWGVVYGRTGHPPPIPEILKPFPSPGPYTPIAPIQPFPEFLEAVP
jgi:hypothetical protein